MGPPSAQSTITTATTTIIFQVAVLHSARLRCPMQLSTVCVFLLIVVCCALFRTLMAGVHQLLVRSQAWYGRLPGFMGNRHGGGTRRVHQNSCAEVNGRVEHDSLEDILIKFLRCAKLGQDRCPMRAACRCCDSIRARCTDLASRACMYVFTINNRSVGTCRRTYQRAIVVPTHSLELIWKNYESFENGVAAASSSAGGGAAAAAKQFSSRVIQEQRSRFIAARMAYWCVCARPVCPRKAQLCCPFNTGMTLQDIVSSMHRKCGVHEDNFHFHSFEGLPSNRLAR